MGLNLIKRRKWDEHQNSSLCFLTVDMMGTRCFKFLPPQLSPLPCSAHWLFVSSNDSSGTKHSFVLVCYNYFWPSIKCHIQSCSPHGHHYLFIYLFMCGWMFVYVYVCPVCMNCAEVRGQLRCSHLVVAHLSLEIVALTRTQGSMIRLNWLISEPLGNPPVSRSWVVLGMELRSLCLSGKHFIDWTLQTASVYFFSAFKVTEWLIDWVVDWLIDEWMCGCRSVPVEVRGWFSGAVFHLPPCWGFRFPSPHRSAEITNASF